MEIEQYCQKILAQELASRKAKNSFYSLRAFARDLGIGSTSLSDTLNGKRSLSKSNVHKVSEKLELSPQQMVMMLKEKKNRSAQDHKELEKLHLEEDTFRLISDWYYLAILSLAKLKINSSDSEWIAKRLGISTFEAKTALNTLVRLGFVETKRGKIYRTTRSITTNRDIPSAAVRKYHRSNLELAAKSLEIDDVKLRDFSSTVMAIDPAKLQSAKDLLNTTIGKVEKILETEKPSEVYNLSIQLIPLTRGDAE